MIYDGITRKQIFELAATTKDPAVTIYVPTARTGVDVLQGRIKLKSLLVEAENLLVAHGMRRTLALDLLAGAAALDLDANFWKDRLDSVAFFIAPDVFQVHHLPFTTVESVQVAKRFNVRPTLTMLNRSLGHYVLALDLKHVRLVHCGPRGAGEVHVTNMPKNLDSFLAIDRADKQVQHFKAGPVGRAGSAIAYSSVDKNAEAKEHVHRFCQAVSRAVEEHLAPSLEPVVLAGTHEVQHAFLEVTKLHHLMEGGIFRSPKMLELDELKAESDPIVSKFADRGRLAAIENYKERAGTGLTSQQIEEIIPAASQGRIDIMMAHDDNFIWGSYETLTDAIKHHEIPVDGDVELINLAAIKTIEGGGTVYSVSEKELQLTGPAAAIFRY